MARDGWVVIIGVRFPVAWTDIGMPARPRLGSVTLVEGPPAWAWHDSAPDLPVPVCSIEPGDPVAGWEVDHVVVTTPDPDGAVGRLVEAGALLRRWGEAQGRRAAFLRAGPVVELVEGPSTLLWGVALATGEPLAAVVARWRSAGWGVSEPRPAVQPGRTLFTVRGKNLAVFDALTRERTGKEPR